MLFDEAWCSRCQRDAAWREDENSGIPCDILSRTLLYDIGHDDYPVEWIEDSVDYPEPASPRCTAFVEVGAPGSTYVQDERQNELPL